MAVSGKNAIIVTMIALPKTISYKWQNLIGAHEVKEHLPILSTATAREICHTSIITRSFTSSIYSAHSSQEVAGGRGGTTVPLLQASQNALLRNE